MLVTIDLDSFWVGVVTTLLGLFVLGVILTARTRKK
jgi:hypothetical protein